MIIKSFFIIAGSLNQSILNHVAISRFDFPHLGTFMALISICAAFFFPPLCCSYSRRRQIGKQLIDKSVQARRRRPAGSSGAFRRSPSHCSLLSGKPSVDTRPHFFAHFLFYIPESGSHALGCLFARAALPSVRGLKTTSKVKYGGFIF